MFFLTYLQKSMNPIPINHSSKPNSIEMETHIALA